ANDGRLSRACRTYERRDLTWLDSEIDVPQNRLFWRVPEADVLKFDSASKSGGFMRLLATRHLELDFHDFLDALEGNCRLGERVRQLREATNRRIQFPEIRQEQHQSSRLETPFDQNEPRSIPHHQPRRQCRHNADAGRQTCFQGASAQREFDGLTT